MKTNKNETSSSTFRYGVIYRYTNLINGKTYIGQTINYKERFRTHKNSSYNPKKSDYNYLFHRAIRKYGIDNFRIDILFAVNAPEFIITKVLDEQEKYWIKEHNSYGESGYNLTEGGGGVIRKHTIEENKRHSEQLKGMFAKEKNPFWKKKWNQTQKDANYTKVLKFDLDDNYICEFESLKDAAFSVGKTHSGNISSCCRGERKKAYGFKWKYKTKN